MSTSHNHSALHVTPALKVHKYSLMLQNYLTPQGTCLLWSILCEDVQDHTNTPMHKPKACSTGGEKVLQVLIRIAVSSADVMKALEERKTTQKQRLHRLGSKQSAGCEPGLGTVPMMAILSPFSSSSCAFLNKVRSWYPWVRLSILSTILPMRSASGKVKLRFFMTKGFSTRPSARIFSSCFSAAVARPDWAPADSFAMRPSCGHKVHSQSHLSLPKLLRTGNHSIPGRLGSRSTGCNSSLRP